MKQSQNLNLKQSQNLGQNLVMTKNLMQSIKLLQFSSMELSSYIAAEIERNPILTSPTDEYEEKSDNHEEEIDDYDEYHESHAELSYKTAGKSNNYNLDDYDLDKIPANEKTLREYVIEQIYVNISDPISRIIAFNLSDFLDENGYFVGDVENIVKATGASNEMVSDIFKRCQHFEPSGVFARSLAECLELQLKDQALYSDKYKILLDNLEVLAKGDKKRLQNLCKIDINTLDQMIVVIRSLNPRPASGFSAEKISGVEADIFLRKKNGDFVVELNSDILPKILINHRYYSEVARSATSRDDKKYLTEQLNTANWLIKALDQRANTILKVATEIVSIQKDFFEYGINYLKPMTLSDVAEKLSIHESTVSRVTNNKYMLTSFGLFELKFFFSSQLSNNENGDDDFSSTTIKFMIKEMVENEEKVLSDDKIAEILNERGINIARRTISKYREMMKIPSSAERKQKKKF